MTYRSGHARWLFNLSKWEPTLDDLMLATSCIQQEEKIRLAKFVFRNDFYASLIGRLMMRSFINCVTTNVKYSDIIIERDERSKPFYLANSDLYVDFNISHQGSYTVLAGCSGSKLEKIQIGVDVMKMEYSGGKSYNEFFRLMNKNFSQHEWGTILKYKSSKCQLNSFMRHWSLKESYVKNIGIGITTDLSKISFIVNSELPKTMLEPIVNTNVEVNGILLNNWSFEEYLIDNNHCAAVSVFNPHNVILPVLNFEEVTFSKIMENSEELLPRDEKYCLEMFEKEFN